MLLIFLVCFARQIPAQCVTLTHAIPDVIRLPSGGFPISLSFFEGAQSLTVNGGKGTSTRAYIPNSANSSGLDISSFGEDDIPTSAAFHPIRTLSLSTVVLFGLVGLIWKREGAPFAVVACVCLASLVSSLCSPSIFVTGSETIAFEGNVSSRLIVTCPGGRTQVIGLIDMQTIVSCVSPTPAPSVSPTSAPTCNRVLLEGGTDFESQGWVSITSGPANVSYSTNLTCIATSTNAGARTSGQLLLHLPGVIPVPYDIEVVMVVQSVVNHNQLDAGVAIMPSLTPNSGTSSERSQMIYFDNTRVGWSDDTQSVNVAVISALHTYLVTVDESLKMTLSIDGIEQLTRNNAVTSSGFAIGDQTNDVNVDGAFCIRSITKLCRT